MRGRPPTPTKLKLLRGNPGKRAINADEPEPPAASRLPGPPSYVAGEALAEWRRSGPKLLRLGLLTELDHQAFIAYCLAWGEFVDMEREISEGSRTITTSNKNQIPNPLLVVRNQALQRCVAFWGRFGMTPSDRSRVHVPKSGAPPKSRLDEFIRRAK